MASFAIDSTRLAAGKAYLRALQDLGLDPDGLFWARERRDNQIVLVLVTSFFDYAGPLEISRLLFKAYNAAATPREVDPFVIRLHSPAQTIIGTLARMLESEIQVRDLNEETGRYKGWYNASEKANVTFTLAGDLEVSVGGIYKMDRKSKAATVDLARKWRRISGNVERLAA